jgi:methylated-DNA-[protein]-cysteine S-methyltransferase
MARVRNNAFVEIIGGKEMTTFYTFFDSPVGRLQLTSNGSSLTGLYMLEHKHGPDAAGGWQMNDNAEPLAETARQLGDYFKGSLRTFNLPVLMHGTDFQRSVWKELSLIPFGETISYGELACRVGNANASRAVGLANGRNPISIIVPCHRVIGANGTLTGYGGGLDRKAKLLDWEKTVLYGPRPTELQTVLEVFS